MAMQIRGNTQILTGTVTTTQVDSSLVNANLAAGAGIVTTKLADGANLAFLDGTRSFTGITNFGGFRVSNIGTPTAAGDAVNLAYLNTLNLGMTLKGPVRLATAAALPTNTYANGSSGVGATLTATANGVLTVDGQTVNINDRILVKNEATAANNGIYTVSTLGTASVAYVLTRATDNNTGGSSGTGTGTGTTGNLQIGDFIIADDGATYKSQAFILTEPSLGFTGSIVVGTTALNYTSYGNPGQLTQGNGIQITGTTITAVAAANSGVQVLAGGISLLLADNSLLTAAGGVSVRPYAGLNTTTNGLNVVAGNGITVAGSAGSGVTVNPLSTGGIGVGASGVYVLLPASSGLTTGASGLSIQLSTSSNLALVTGGLGLANFTAGSLLIGQGAGTPPAPTAISGDATLTAAGVLTLTSAAGGGAVKASNFASGEVLSTSGTVNSSNVTFTTAATPIANTESLYVNGLRQQRTVDYTMLTSTITFIVAPTTGDKVVIDYLH